MVVVAARVATRREYSSVLWLAPSAVGTNLEEVEFLLQ
jgi:hypothetical protein